MFVMAKGELNEDGFALTASQGFASDELPQRSGPSGRPDKRQ